MFREKEDREGGGVLSGTGSVFSKSHEASPERRRQDKQEARGKLGKNVSNLSEYNDNEQL